VLAEVVQIGQLEMAGFRQLKRLPSRLCKQQAHVMEPRIVSNLMLETDLINSVHLPHTLRPWGTALAAHAFDHLLLALC
jgi:hypothetical protein